MGMADETLIAVQDYLALFDEIPASEMDDLEKLARILDRLAVCIYCDAEGSPGEDKNPPDTSYSDLRKAAERRFPTLGYYPYVDPSEPHDTAELLVGDAHDDLADIARDLTQIVWRWKNVSPEDALWYFKLLYRSHWGNHLHDLRRYLHARIYY